MKQKLLTFFSRWTAANRIMHSKEFFLVVIDSDGPKVVHSEISTETAETVIKYISVAAEYKTKTV